MTKTAGFGKRTKKQKYRYSHKGDSVSMIWNEFDNAYEVAVFFKDGRSYAERHLTKTEAIKLYKHYKRMIQHI